MILSLWVPVGSALTTCVCVSGLVWTPSMLWVDMLAMLHRAGAVSVGAVSVARRVSSRVWTTMGP